MLSFMLCTLILALPSSPGRQGNVAVQVVGKPSSAASSLAADPPNMPDLNADARLGAMISLQARSQALSDCLQTVREQTGVNLSVAEDVGQRRVSVLAARLSLRDWMQAVIDTTGLSWKIANEDSIQRQQTSQDTRERVGTEKPAAAYELYLGKVQRSKEQARVEESAKRAQWSLNTQRERLLTLAGDAKGPFASIIALLSPDQLSQACELAAQPIGAYSANNNSHYFDHLTGVRPFAGLPPDVQANVRHMLVRPETIGGPNAAPLAPALPKTDDLNQSYIGIVAADGGLSLGVIPPDGKDVWVSLDNHVHRSGIAGIDTDDDSNPEVTDQMAKVTLLDMSSVPNPIRHKKLHFPDGFDRTSLPDLLQVLAQQTGLAIVADDWMRSRRTIYSQLLTDKAEYTLNEACEQIAKAYGHRMAYKEGVLRVSTVSLGLDLRTEPPSDLLAHLRELTTKKLPVTLADYVMLGRMPRLQLDTLAMSHFPGISQGGLLLSAQRGYDVLHFYALLPLALRDKAAAQEGLTIRDLNARQREAFSTLGGIGMPRVTAALASAQPKTLSAGLYVYKREVNGRLQNLTFVVAADTRSCVVTEYRLGM